MTERSSVFHPSRFGAVSGPHDSLRRSDCNARLGRPNHGVGVRPFALPVS
jgi:hypothetical protein